MRAQAELALKAVRFGYAAGAWELCIPALALGSQPICGIVGPNGSGKSTLLKIAAGLLAPGAGAVELDGKPLGRMRRADIARVLGFLPQECPVLFDYTVEQIAAMGRHAHGGVLEMAAPGDREAVARALDAVNLEPLRQRTFSHLSGGERRRAWIASALAQEPALLLLDEPTQALDLHQAAMLMEVLARKAAEGMRVVVVMHDLTLAGLFCDRLILLQDGAIAADGIPGEILTPERLGPAFGDKIEVVRHPDTQKPLILAKK